jgi:acetyl esterase
MAQVLHEMQTTEEPNWDSLTEMRAAVNTAIRELTGDPPSPLAAQVTSRDRQAPGPAGALPLRCYVPPQRTRPPLMVFFHGGGWVYGSVDAYDPFCRALAADSGCMVLSVGYRLAPEKKFPAAIKDAWTATVWAAEHAEELGADKTRLAVAGESAGGNLAAAVALLARDRGPALAHQLLLYPVLDLVNMDRPSYRLYGEMETLSRSMMQWLRDQYLQRPGDVEDPRASPLRADSLAGLPPATVLNAGHDVLRDEGEEYVRRLQSEGVPARWLHYPDMAHGFLNMGLRVDRAWEALRDVGLVVRQCLA